MGWLRQIPWFYWLTLAATPLALLWRFKKQFTERQAENWPTAEGRVWSTVGSGVQPSEDAQRYKVCFTYSFSLAVNGETDYYSGKFSRMFSDEIQGQKWLDSLKEKKIPIRVKPGDSNVSAVLFTDLVAKFPLPVPAMLIGGLEVTEPGSRLPYVLRWPTEMMASLIALGFSLSMIDHLYRVIADRPFHPKLAIGLWIGFAVVVVPFELWFHRISGSFSFTRRKARNKGPLYLRILTYVLNFYVASNCLIQGTNFAQYFHLRVERFEPMMNGAFLALMLGNYAASLYGRLESMEESPGISASMIQPE
jgi:hypothetical protein